MDLLYPDLPLAVLRQVARSPTYAPLSSSVGRLFDAFAAALQLSPRVQSHEGEAAMRLEALAAQVRYPVAPYPMTPGVLIDPSPLFRAWAEDKRADTAPSLMAARFHAGVAKAFANSARHLVETGAAKAVALSGGCFQNAILLGMTLRALDGIPVLIHRTSPANDGGLALGQALVAAAQTL